MTKDAAQERKTIRAMLLEDLQGQGELVLAQLPSLEEQAASAAAYLDERGLSALYIAGCGDSLYVGEATAGLFWHCAGLRAYPAESFEFTRYGCQRAPGGAALVAISISGQVGTTLDAIEAAQGQGMRAVGLNATPGSKIYTVADRVLDIGVRVREPGPVPQTYHYLANMTALALLALALGRRRGVLAREPYEALRQAIGYNLGAMRGNAAALLGPVLALAQGVRTGRHKQIVFVGPGPNEATARFASAKLVEAACMGSIWQETEEWAHEQYFITDRETLSFVFAPAGPSLARSRQILEAMAGLGGTGVAVTGAPEKMPRGSVLLPVDMAPNELLSPMALPLAAEIFAYWVAELYDVRPFRYDDALRKRVCEATIYDGGTSAEAVARRRGDS